MPNGGLGGAVPQRGGAKGLGEGRLDCRGDPGTCVEAVRRGFRISPAARTAGGFGREAICNPGGGPTATDGNQVQSGGLIETTVGSEAPEEQG